ncbi:unnamed protein product [Dovyalis caffra]|uniref:Uncharacterized protein n=1 Tax=Dovyalis caffra TaxID=77055 RepID=A0AAV1SUU4_9ROSI|nr:unnamed protein product [Dovyalis caffra]
MALTLTFASSLPAPVQASSRSSRKTDPYGKKTGSSTWWAPLFGWSSSPDYINSGSAGGTSDDVPDKESGLLGSDKGPGPRSRFALGSFTEEKAKQLRRKTIEGSTFHDMMYHSAIASRLALDGSGRPEKLQSTPAWIDRRKKGDMLDAVELGFD